MIRVETCPKTGLGLKGFYFLPPSPPPRPASPCLACLGVCVGWGWGGVPLLIKVIVRIITECFELVWNTILAQALRLLRVLVAVLSCENLPA